MCVPLRRAAWALCSADLHLSAKDDDAVRSGEFTWVVGEVHALHEVLCVVGGDQAKVQERLDRFTQFAAQSFAHRCPCGATIRS